MSSAAVLSLILLGADSPGAAWPAVAGLLVVLGLVGAYVVFVLPHLNDGPALLVSGLIAAVLLVASTLTAMLAEHGLPVLAAWGALVIAHLALRAGRGQAPVRMPARPRAAPTAPTSPAVAPVPATLAPAPERTRLGRYRIERQLGRGAMGAVYLGQDPKIGRPLAIKTMALAQEFDGAALAEARERFFREAETAGRLRHPDIVTIFDAGEDDDLAWIAMEFVAGHDLQRHTRIDTLLPVPQVLRVVERVAIALAHAHSQGVVHRDIKPANVMVDLDAPGGMAVKVTDFGIARIGDASRTRTGMVLGTPAFMSPEQMAGHRVDGRSDLYSLGVMLFQLLTGRLPHHAESMAKLMGLIANERAPDVRSIRPELPEALADIVALALEKRPEVRYADGHQLAQDLQAVQAMYDAGATAVAPPVEGGEPADAFAATVRFIRDDPGHNPRG